jgi:putative membrane protein
MPGVGLLEILVVFVIGAFWVAVIALLILGARALTTRRGDAARTRDGSATDPAMDDLRGRFARGEIDEAEYQRRRSILQGH